MAIIPSSRYPAQVDADPDYPQGKARNAASFQDGSGTPLEKDWLNDLFGFQQALLAAAAITPTGDPDKVGESQYLLSLIAVAHRILSGATLTVDSGGVIQVNSYGDLNIASSADLNVADGGDINLASGAELNVASGGKIDILTGGHIDLRGEINVESGGHIDVESGGHIDIASGGDLNVASGGDINLAAGASLTLASGADVAVASGGIVNFNGGRLDLNTGSEMNVEGSAHIDVEGSIEVLATGNINVGAGGNVNLKSGGDLIVEFGGHIISQTGSTVRIEASGDLSINNAPEGFRLTLTPAFHDGLGPWSRTTDASGLLGWFQSDVSARRSIWFALPVVPGDTVVNVYVCIDGDASGSGHGGTPPATQPTVELISVDSIGALTVHATKNGDAVGAGYDATHDIILQAGTLTTGAMPHLATADPMYIRIRGEYGPGTAVPGLTLLSISGNIIARSYRTGNMVR